MRVAISGAQSVGKSTLIKRLFEDDEIKIRFKKFGNVARSIKKEGFDINEDGDDACQRLVMAKHLEYSAYDNGIFDRCALDGLAYTVYLHRREMIEKNTLIIAESIFENTHYDINIFIEPEFPITKDGVRSNSSAFQYEINEIFEELIDLYRLFVIRPTGTVENRYRMVKSAIDDITEKERDKFELFPSDPIDA
jgi:nicotinamide riboside kinase